MKQILFSVFALAALSGCSKAESGEQEIPDGSTEIVLSAGVPSATITPNTKAPIQTGDKFAALVAGWESATGSVNYTAPQAWSTPTLEITAGTAAQPITLTTKQSYNADKDTKTYMKAWYPQGTLANGVVTFAAAGDFKGDGTDDVLLAPEVVGSKIDRLNKTLSFAHKTTQLKFVVQANDGGETTLTSLTIRDAELPTGITLADNKVSYAAAANLPVPDAGGTAIGKSPAAAGKAVMMKPRSGNTLTLDIVTAAGSYPGVTATLDDTTFVEGKAYTITLTFGPTGVALQAAVAEWTTGTGSGNVG